MHSAALSTSWRAMIQRWRNGSSTTSPVDASSFIKFGARFKSSALSFAVSLLAERRDCDAWPVSAIDFLGDGRGTDIKPKSRKRGGCGSISFECRSSSSSLQIMKYIPFKQALGFFLSCVQDSNTTLLLV